MGMGMFKVCYDEHSRRLGFSVLVVALMLARDFTLPTTRQHGCDIILMESDAHHALSIIPCHHTESFVGM